MKKFEVLVGPNISVAAKELRDILPHVDGMKIAPIARPGKAIIEVEAWDCLMPRRKN